MADALEKQQKRAMKIIYGFETKYEDVLEKTGMKTMTKRREEAYKSFTRKLAESARFGDTFFPKTIIEPENMVLRNINVFSKIRKTLSIASLLYATFFK